MWRVDAPLTLAELLPKAGSITVLTGAGISTDSGIPDFRGPQGVWTKDPAAEAMSTIGAYLADPEVRRRAWRARRDNPVWEAEPNAAHTALAELERAGRLRALITQNIDGLHQRAGSSGEKVIEIHGTMRDAVCLSCGLRTPMPDILARVDAGRMTRPAWSAGASRSPRRSPSARPSTSTCWTRRSPPPAPATCSSPSAPR